MGAAELDVRGALTSAAKLTTIRDDGEIARCRSDRTDRLAHAATDRRRVHAQLGHRAAQRVAVHAECFGGLALIATMLRENFVEKTLLELADGVGIAHARCVHLRDEDIEIAFHLGDVTLLSLA